MELLTYKNERKDEEPTEVIKLHHVQFVVPSEDCVPDLEIVELKTHDREFKFGFCSTAERVEWQGRIARSISRLLKSTFRDNLTT